MNRIKKFLVSPILVLSIILCSITTYATPVGEVLTENVQDNQEVGVLENQETDEIFEMRPDNVEEWCGGHLSADLLEADENAEIMLAEEIMLVEEIMPPSSAYTIESDHFIIDSSIYGYLTPANIAPEVFNEYLSRMDDCYEAMQEVTGRTPNNGNKITIMARTASHSSHIQFTLGGEDYIYWNVDRIMDILNEIKRCLPVAEEDSVNVNLWLGGSVHELGHIFCSALSWNWVNGEANATYLAWLYIEKAFIESENTPDSPIIVEDMLLTYWKDNVNGYPAANNTIFSKGSNIVFLINPIFSISAWQGEENSSWATCWENASVAEREAAWNNGWNILKNVFRSYFDESYDTIDYAGNESQVCLADFIDRCSHFMGPDMLTGGAWIDGTKEQCDDLLSPIGEPYITIYPLHPKVGDEITFSVHNCPDDNFYIIYLRIGNIMSAKRFDLEQGDNLDIPFGESLEFVDIGKKLQMNVSMGGTKVYSNMTTPVISSTIVRNNMTYMNDSFILDSIEIINPELANETICVDCQIVSAEGNYAISNEVEMSADGSGSLQLDQMQTEENDYIEIKIYRDEERQQLMSRHFVEPVWFAF